MIMELAITHAPTPLLAISVLDDVLQAHSRSIADTRIRPRPVEGMWDPLHRPILFLDSQKTRQSVDKLVYMRLEHYAIPICCCVKFADMIYNLGVLESCGNRSIGNASVLHDVRSGRQSV